MYIVYLGVSSKKLLCLSILFNFCCTGLILGCQCRQWIGAILDNLQSLLPQVHFSFLLSGINRYGWFLGTLLKYPRLYKVCQKLKSTDNRTGHGIAQFHDLVFFYWCGVTSATAIIYGAIWDPALATKFESNFWWCGNDCCCHFNIGRNIAANIISPANDLHSWPPKNKFQNWWFYHRYYCSHLPEVADRVVIFLPG
jgi:hypothetical protein